MSVEKKQIKIRLCTKEVSTGGYLPPTKPCYKPAKYLVNGNLARCRLHARKELSLAELHNKPIMVEPVKKL